MEMKDTAPAQGGIQMGRLDVININTPRQYRAVSALNKRPRCREDLDHIVGTSNSPEVIRQLRGQGWEVPCELVPHIDSDGVKGRHGIYSLSHLDRLRLREWLGRTKSDGGDFPGKKVVARNGVGHEALSL